MAGSIYKVHEMINKVGFEFDDATAKRVAQLAEKAGKMAAQNMTKELSSIVAEMGSIFNQTLTDMGKQPIDLTDMLKIPDSGTINKLTSSFVSQITSSMSSGIGATDIIGQNATLEARKAELNSLKREQQRLIKEREEAQRNIKNKTRIQELNEFSPYEAQPLEIDGDIAKEAGALLNELSTMSDKIAGMIQRDETEAREFIQTVLDAQAKLNDFYRMRQTLLQTKTPVSPELSELYGLSHRRAADLSIDEKMFPNSEKGESIVLGFEDVSDIVLDASTDIQVIDSQLAEIEQKINNIVQTSKGIGGNLTGEILDGENNLEQARQRMLNKNKKTYNAKKVKDLGALVSDDPTHIADSLEKLKVEYDKSVAEQQGWEVEYQWLVKFVQKYEELLSKGSNKEQLSKFAGVYDTFMSQYPEAISSLKELKNIVDTTPPSSKQKKSDKDVNNAEMIAESSTKARAETEAKAKADTEAAAAVEKERLAQEAAAKAAKEKADARRTELVNAMSSLGVTDGYTTGGVLDNPAFAHMFGKTKGESAFSGTEQVNQSLAEQSNLLTNIERLTSYIDEEYLSAGKHLSHFLNDLQTQSLKLDGELKNILTTLKLIDENGNLTFAIRQNGEQGGGTTHNGALISDMFTMIERSGYQGVKDSHLPVSTQQAYQEGLNVAQILDYIPSKTVDAFFDVQSTAKGHNLFQGGILSQDVVNATETQLQQLVNAFITARNHGFDIENGGSNIVYDKNKGFSFYDLEEWSTEDTAYWNNLSDTKKNMRALEDALSIFGQFDGENLNRDYTNLTKDPNRLNFIEKFKQAISHDANFKDLPYQDVFSDVFDEYYDENNNLKVRSEIQAHQENAAAINAETQAQENLNAAESQNPQTSGTYDAEKQSVDGLNDSLEKKNAIENTDNDGAEVADENAKTEAIKQQNAALQENITLKGQANGQVVGGTGTEGTPTQTTPDGATSGEVTELEAVRAKVLEVTNAVNTKTQAFFAEQKAVKSVAQSEVHALGEIEKKVTAVRVALNNLQTKQHKINLSVAGGEDISNISATETQALTKLRAALQLTTKRVNEKTQAFETEKTVVNKVVSSEIGALGRLNTQVDTVNQTVMNLLTNIQTAQTGMSNIVIPQAQPVTQNTNAKGQGSGGGGTSPQLLGAKIDTQFSSLSLMYAQLESVGKLTPEIEQQWLQLWDSLSKVNNVSSLQLWREQLAQVKNSMKEIMIANNLVEQEGVQSFQQLINVTKLYNQMLINSKKAKTSEERGVYEQEANAALVEQQRILQGITLTKEQQAQYDELKIERERQLNIIKAQQTGREKQIQNAQVEAETVKQLVKLYEQLGRAQFLGDTQGAADIRQQIGAERANLSSVDYATDMKFMHAKEKGYNAEKTKAENVALKEEKRTIEELNRLYQEYGALKERAQGIGGDATREVADVASKDTEAEIQRLRQSLTNITSEMEVDFTKSMDAGSRAERLKQYEALAKKIDQDEITRRKKIEAIEKEIGKLRAEANNTTNTGVKGALEQEIQLREALIALQEKGLAMDAQDEAYYKTTAANKTKQAKDIAKQEQKDQAEVFNEQIKNARYEAGVGKSKSVVSRAVETFAQVGQLQGIDPSQQASLDAYQAKILELSNTIANFPKNDLATEEQKNQLIQQRLEVDALTKEYQELISQNERLNSSNAMNTGVNMKGVLGTGDDNIQAQLTQQVQALTKGRAHIKSYNAETRQLTYTLNDTKGAMTQYTAEIGKTNGMLYTIRGTTTRAMGVFESIGKKIKEYSYYFTGSMMIYRVIAWIREGVTAVKEIDTALTELKKVTDETEESYDKFLDTAAKTASKVGSTVKDVVNSTADWARLGYAMEEAHQLATSTQILMNVSEFDDVSKATDTLISSVQAFKYTAEESMDVVDILNTIGNNYAISTADLATSLTKSSGSLVAANGTLEEAVALTATANTIIQDADVVGK